MNTPHEQLHKWLLDRERDLDRVRTRGLARQQWAAVIEVEAKLRELKLVRETLVKIIEERARPTVMGITGQQT